MTNKVYIHTVVRGSMVKISIETTDVKNYDYFTNFIKEGKTTVSMFGKMWSVPTVSFGFPFVVNATLEAPSLKIEYESESDSKKSGCNC